MTVTDACQAAQVARATLVKFEAGGDVRPATAERLRVAFEGRGVEFAVSGIALSWSPEIVA